jgi:hypothetical protein
MELMKLQHGLKAKQMRRNDFAVVRTGSHVEKMGRKCNRIDHFNQEQKN